MKIAFFTDTYYPQINGVTKSIDIFAKQLRKHGDEVHIFCPEGIRRERYVHPISSLEFINYPEYKIGLPNLKIINEIKKINADVIHLHSPFSIGVAGMSVAKILKIPIVATYHTLLSEYFNYMGDANFTDEMAHKYTRWFFDRASIIISPSKPIKNMLKKCNIKKPIEILPTPLDLKIINSKKNNKKLTILHVGRVCKEKRIGVILNAFEKIHKKIDSRLIITSDGPYRKSLEKLCRKLKIEKDVIFTGYVSDKELLKIYSSADVFVSASDTETQGLVVLEAMACGCPVIVKNALGFKDFIQDRENGMLFNTEDKLIKDVLLIKKDSRLRKRLIKNGYDTVRKFNVSYYVDRLEGIYKKSLELKMGSKILWKILYFSYLLFGSIESYILKHMKIPVNSRFLDLHLRFFRRALFFERLR